MPNGNDDKPKVGFGPQITGQPIQSRRGDHSARTTADTFHGLIQGMQTGHIAKELIHPGKDPREMLMRTNLRDENQARDVAMFRYKCKRFKLPTAREELVTEWLELLNSIDGHGRKEFIMLGTGVVVPSYIGGKGSKVYDSNRRSNNEDDDRR